MRKYLTILICLLIWIPILVQAQGRYWVQFKDRFNSPYSVSNPSAFLSQRALDRRTVQGITITQDDLPVNPVYVAGVAATGATILNRSKWFNAVTVNFTDPAILPLISALPYVQQVQYVAPVMRGNIPPVKKDKWSLITSIFKRNRSTPKHSLNFNYGLSYNQIHQMNGDLLHEMGYRGQGMIIAVLDAGFYKVDTLTVFDSLWDNGQILGTRDFVEKNGNVFQKSSHGMNVLSTMGGNIPGMIIGTAPKASYWLLRSEDENSEYLIEEDNWVSAAEFADSAGVDVINSSLGYTEFNDPTMNHTYLQMNGNTSRASIAATRAARKGIIVCNSAGNSGGNQWHYIGAPADADSILTVGAVDEWGSYAWFSSTGPTSDGRIKPSVATQGQGTYVANASGSVFQGNGTSFASPVLCGMVACLWQANPGMKNMDVMASILQSASQHNNPDSLLGYGIPDFQLANLYLSGKAFPNIEEGLAPGLYPNPCTDEFTLCFSNKDTQEVKVEVFGINGQFISGFPLQSVFPGNNRLHYTLPPQTGKGIYFVRIYSKEKQWVKKLTKL